MSGGSFDYLGIATNSHDLIETTPAGGNLRRMADELSALGHDDVARETHEAELLIRAARARLDAIARRCQPVWKAVEWWRSMDYRQEAVDEAVAEYRGRERDER